MTMGDKIGIEYCHVSSPQTQQQPPQDTAMTAQQFPTNLTSLGLQMKRLDQDLDAFIRKQNEDLRVAIRKTERQQLISLVKRFEFESHNLLKQKQAEIERARLRTVQLLESLRQSQSESLTWQALAREHETEALDLRTNLASIQRDINNNELLVLESASASASTSAFASCEERIGRRRRQCKGCDDGEVCVLFFPCKHLCCCARCGVVLLSCPVCGAPKTCCIEVFMS